MPCIKSLIADYKRAGGVCAGSWNEGGYPESATPCDVQGLCSPETESMLLEEECRDYVWNSKDEVLRTISSGLINTMCNSNIYNAFAPLSVNNNISLNQSLQQSDNKRLIPITGVYDSAYYNTVYTTGPISDLNNTKNRYSWLCSLRLKSEDKRHLCGVTLLSMPPSPTVLISAAHCVTICRSSASNKVLDNCCCENVGGEICSDNPECEDDARIVDITGDYAEIVCGEWETGPTPANESGEEYNIILPIRNVTRHPNYTISRGERNSQFVANDLVVFFVDDKSLKQSQDRIVPICIPSGNSQSPSTAIHSGWSSPPPLEFLEENLPLFVPYHQEFYKLWHHFMKITRCEDPNRGFKFPSNSSYPPGVICAIETFDEFCPSSGESGSPLMVKEDEKFTITGIQSFIKGCSVFTYRYDDYPSSLTQKSLNPSVYTKISCFLPWIAQQYGMFYEIDDTNDPDCISGTGDINEVTAEVCTVLPITYALGVYTVIDPKEAECVFPFTVDGREWDGCLVSGIQDFTHPVFRCPIRTLKNRNTTYFTNYKTANGQIVNEVLNGFYCPTNCVGADYELTPTVGFINSITVRYFFNSDGPVFGPNGEYELDPDNNQCSTGLLIDVDNVKLPVFGTCKNNCRGGKINTNLINQNFIFYFQLISQLLLGDLPCCQ